MTTHFQLMVIKVFNMFKKTETVSATEITKLQEQLADLAMRVHANEASIEKLTDHIAQLSDMIQIIAAAHAELANDISRVYSALTGQGESKSSGSVFRFPLVANDDDDLIN